MINIYKIVQVFSAILFSVNAFAVNLDVQSSAMESDLENRLRPDMDAMIGTGKYSLDLNIILGIKKSDVQKEVDNFEAVMMKANEIKEKCIAMVDGLKPAPVADKPKLLSKTSLPGLPALKRSGDRSPVSENASTIKDTVNSMMAMLAMNKCQEQFSQFTVSQPSVTYPPENEIYIKNIKMSLIVDDDVNEISIDMAKAQILSKSNFTSSRGDKLDITEFDFDGVSPLQSGLLPDMVKLYKEQPVVFFIILGAILLIFLSLIMRRRKVQPASLKPNPGSSGKKSNYSVALEKSDELSLRKEATELINIIVRNQMRAPSILTEIIEEKPEFLSECKASIFLVRGRAGVNQLFDISSEAEFTQMAANRDSLRMSDAVSNLKELISYMDLVEVSDKTSTNNPFDFLVGMSVDDIKQIMSDMRVNDQAILLTQVDATVSAKILKKLSAEDRGGLLVIMSKTVSVNPAELIAVAESAAIAARNQPKLKNIASSGVDITGDILDALGEADQLEALDTIRLSNPAAYINVRESLILWQDLLRIPKKTLGQILLDLEPDLISSALLDVEDEFSDYVLGSLPTRFRTRVAGESESANGKSNYSTISAKGMILKSIRTAVSDGVLNKGDMAELDLSASQNIMATA